MGFGLGSSQLLGMWDFEGRRKYRDAGKPRTRVAVTGVCDRAGVFLHGASQFYATTGGGGGGRLDRR